MSPYTSEAQQNITVESWRDDIHVRQVRAAEIRIVMDKDVTRLETLPGCNHRLNRIRHGAEVYRQVRALGHHLSLAVEDAAGIVTGNFEDW